MSKTKKLTKTDVRKPLPFNINHGMADISIRELLDPKRDIEIDWDVYLPTKCKNLQRGFVWTLEQKQELIYSVFKGIKLPPISVIYLDHKIYRIIDGKQRLSTLVSFCKNEFPINWNGESYYFKDLDESLTGEFLYHGLIRADIGYEYSEKPISDEDKIAWFEMINFAGTPQDLEHLENLKK